MEFSFKKNFFLVLFQYFFQCHNFSSHKNELKFCRHEQYLKYDFADYLSKSSLLESL